jgi:hypothetical protein
MTQLRMAVAAEWWGRLMKCSLCSFSAFRFSRIRKEDNHWIMLGFFPMRCLHCRRRTRVNALQAFWITLRRRFHHSRRHAPQLSRHA